jgi:hypothetical protein
MFVGMPPIALMTAEGRGARGEAEMRHLKQDDLQRFGDGQAAPSITEPAAVS